MTAEDELHRSLVERIVQSETFAKSERLISFLNCICDPSIRDEQRNLNEQYIGTTVFGRRPDYDPGVDSIVRSHASRLRHRLDRYFAEEGAHEELLLKIPKGGYTPVFEPRPKALEAEPMPSPFTVFPGQVSAVWKGPSSEPAPMPKVEERAPQNTFALWFALGLMTIFAMTAAGRLWFEHRPSRVRTESQRLFWSHLFNPEQNTVVVAADSGLVMLQGLTKRPITLDAYVSGEYLNDLPKTAYPIEQTLNLARRRYTSFVDLLIQNRILRLPPNDTARTRFRYSRDVRPEELKQGNVVLLGTYESTPWVRLFEPGMNFYFQNDLAGGVFSIINRSPRANEEKLYSSVNGDALHTVYGVIAYRPSLSGSGNVLILEGQSMAGTETAADFVFDDGYLLPFLRSIQRRDGSIPYFELVLRSSSLSGESSRLEMVASRIQDH